MKLKKYLNEGRVSQRSFNDPMAPKLPKKAKEFYGIISRDEREAGMSSPELAYVLYKDQNKHDGYERLDKDEVMIWKKNEGFSSWSEMGIFKKKNIYKKFGKKI
jgi:hypothetical protein